MKLILIIAVFGLPTAEIITFIEIGGILGLGPTIGIILLTAIIGAVQLKSQGSATLYKVMECLNQGRFPIDEAFDGCCLILASTLLLTPGFITDFVGLLLFAPLFRVNLRRLLARYIFFLGCCHVIKLAVEYHSIMGVWGIINIRIIYVNMIGCKNVAGKKAT